MKTLQRKRIWGFTVIELMIVVIIVAILVALAYPSYLNYTRKANRGDGQRLLMNWAVNQEIWRSNNSPYAPDTSTDLPPPADSEGRYNFNAYLAVATPATCAGLSGVPSATAYWLVAVAQGDQVNDVARDGTSCATLCLSSAGPKEPAVCWQ